MPVVQDTSFVMKRQGQQRPGAALRRRCLGRDCAEPTQFAGQVCAAVVGQLVRDLIEEHVVRQEKLAPNDRLTHIATVIGYPLACAVARGAGPGNG